MIKRKNRSALLIIFALFACLVWGETLVMSAGEQPAAASTDTSAQKNQELSSEDKAIAEQKELLEQIDNYNSQLDKLRQDADKLSGDQKDALGLQILETERALRQKLAKLLTLLQNSKDEQGSNSEILIEAKKILTAESTVLRKELQYVQNQITGLQKGQGELEPLELVKRQQQINKKYQVIDGLLGDLLNNAQQMQSVDLPASDDLGLLDELLQQRAATVSREIKLIMEKLSGLKKQQSRASGGDLEKIKTEILAIEEEKQGASESLADLVDLMQTRNMETTQYSEQLIKATGQISSEILDSSVLISLAEHGVEFVRDWLRENGVGILVKFFFVVFLLFAFKLMAGLVKRLVRRAIGGDRSNMSHLMSNFIISMSGKLVMVVGLLVALSQIGIKIAPLLAGLGIAGFIVGFALQDVLSNFASGVMILIYRPFDVGDTIEVPEVSGKVRHMNLVSTIVLTYDNQKLVVPNNKIWGSIIRNIHSERLRRVDLTFGISYDDDLDHAERVLREILEGHELILDDPKYNIRLHQLGESSVDFIVRPWTKTENYWDVYWDVTRTVKQRFDAEGISIPYPQRDVHLQNFAPDAAPPAASE
jgi:small conductance mechanosensitive channel